MRSKQKNRRALGAAVALLALAALAALGLLIALLAKGVAAIAGPDMRRLSDVRAVALSAGWSSYFLQPHTQEEQQAYLDGTLDEAAALGANTLLLTGRVDDAPGQVLFRVREKEGWPATASAVSENDRLFKTFDPMQYLLKQADGRDMQVALLATGDTGTVLVDGEAPPAWLAETAKKYKLDLYSQATAQATAVTSYVSYGEGPDLLRKDGDAALLAAAWQLNAGRGLVLGDLAALAADGANAAVALRFVSGGSLPQIMDKTVPQTLSIVTPNAGSTAYGDEIYLIGTSDPSLPLTVNGQPVARTGSLGVWGVLLPMNEGQNNYSAVQGETTVTVTVTKGTSGGGTTGTPRPDGSVAAKPGQKLRITQTLASQLSEYANSDSIVMTAYEGAVATVRGSVSFVRSGQRTYAYLLENGAYILAKDCELLDPGTADAAFTGAGHSTQGSTELLDLTGTGTPMYTHTWQGNELTLNFLSAGFTGSLPANFGFGGATVRAEQTETGFSLHFVFNEVDPLWGYHVEYTPEGGTRILLKHQPRRSDAETGPLTGVTVMLDAGHGDTDMGAVGSASAEFPQEKDLNLALALAARYRLEQLGATVLMTRDTDVFHSLGERVEMLNAQRPDFFIALHHNSTLLNKDAGELTGTECYWFYTEGKPLAEALVSRVSAAAGRQARGSFYNYFYVTRSNLCPAVLLETGFVSSPAEYQSCADAQTLWAEGGAIAQAVLDCVPE